MLLPLFDVLCDLLLNWPTATWNLFVSRNKEAKCFHGDLIFVSVLEQIKKFASNSGYYIIRDYSE